jgi:hypothetical protein
VIHVEREENGFRTVHRLVKEALSTMKEQTHMKDISLYIFDIVAAERNASIINKQVHMNCWRD